MAGEQPKRPNDAMPLVIFAVIAVAVLVVAGLFEGNSRDEKTAEAPVQTTGSR